MIDFDKKDFFKRWAVGVKLFADSPKGLILSKLFFLFFVILGLFMSGLLYWVGESKNFWLGVVLVSFGFVSLIDFRVLLKQYKFFCKGNNLLGGAK